MHEELQRREKPTKEEGVLDISLNFLANPKSHSCSTKDKGLYHIEEIEEQQKEFGA